MPCSVAPKCAVGTLRKPNHLLQLELTLKRPYSRCWSGFLLAAESVLGGFKSLSRAMLDDAQKLMLAYEALSSKQLRESFWRLSSHGGGSAERLKVVWALFVQRNLATALAGIVCRSKLKAAGALQGEPQGPVDSLRPRRAESAQSHSAICCRLNRQKPKPITRNCNSEGTLYLPTTRTSNCPPSAVDRKS